MTFRTIAAIAAATAILATVAVADEKRRTDSGRVVQFSDWKDRKPHEAMINVIDLEKFPPIEEVTVQQRTRDNAMTRQRIRFDRMQVSIMVDHFPVGYFALSATDTVHSESKTKARVRKYGLKSHERDEATFEESRKVYSYGRRGGWVHAVEIGPRKSCVFGMMGLLSRGKSAPTEQYDTIISIKDCSGNRSIKHYEAFLKDLKMVPPEYNR